MKNVSPVTYFEEAEKKKGKASKEVVLWIGEGGERPEIYTDEHEKLLGNTERTWELFVDGYAPDGKRIYDPVRGKTCHQCRFELWILLLADCLVSNGLMVTGRRRLVIVPNAASVTRLSQVNSVEIVCT